jgi:glycine oxidase
MLAPAFETLFDPPAALHQASEHLALLTAARDLWPGLASRIGLAGSLDRTGAVLAGFAGDEGALADAEARMRALGLAPERLNGAGLQRLHPGLAAAALQGLATREDWRVEPLAALAALASAVVEAGGRIVRGPLHGMGEALALEGRPVEGAVVVATGADAAGLAWIAPELALLSPVKGQILQFAAAPLSGSVVRSLSGYLAPQPGGALAGATMEPGRRDLDLDTAVLARLRAGAARLFPHLAEAPAKGRAGVRAATPDGLPLVGRSAGPGRADVLLCTGARRNGWLLAPLAAEVVVRTLAGADPGAAGAAFDPRRFG